MNDFDEKYYILISEDNRTRIRYEQNEHDEAQKHFESSDKWKKLEEHTVVMINEK